MRKTAKGIKEKIKKPNEITNDGHVQFKQPQPQPPHPHSKGIDIKHLNLNLNLLKSEKRTEKHSDKHAKKAEIPERRPKTARTEKTASPKSLHSSPSPRKRHILNPLNIPSAMNNKSKLSRSHSAKTIPYQQPKTYNSEKAENIEEGEEVGGAHCSALKFNESVEIPQKSLSSREEKKGIVGVVEESTVRRSVTDERNEIKRRIKKDGTPSKPVEGSRTPEPVKTVMRVEPDQEYQRAISEGHAQKRRIKRDKKPPVEDTKSTNQALLSASSSISNSTSSYPNSTSVPHSNNLDSNSQTTNSISNSSYKARTLDLGTASSLAMDREEKENYKVNTLPIEKPRPSDLPRAKTRLIEGMSPNAKKIPRTHQTDPYASQLSNNHNQKAAPKIPEPNGVVDVTILKQQLALQQQEGNEKYLIEDIIFSKVLSEKYVIGYVVYRCLQHWRMEDSPKIIKECHKAVMECKNSKILLFYWLSNSLCMLYLSTNKASLLHQEIQSLVNSTFQQLVKNLETQLEPVLTSSLKEFFTSQNMMNIGPLNDVFSLIKKYVQVANEHCVFTGVLNQYLKTIFQKFQNCILKALGELSFATYTLGIQLKMILNHIQDWSLTIQREIYSQAMQNLEIIKQTANILCLLQKDELADIHFRSTVCPLLSPKFLHSLLKIYRADGIDIHGQISSNVLTLLEKDYQNDPVLGNTISPFLQMQTEIPCDLDFSFEYSPALNLSKIRIPQVVLDRQGFYFLKSISLSSDVPSTPW
eukprot:TRINITY_DN6116_c0_g1_i1.p1 TRINITY_DN6116_c0_g1~~TRINITY_DN6116_c0_g1_i1.p1  ORF type:complete len:754 (+),score=139.85 TRINITY_DN6116_c0_g1_i1:42-2303(+)